MSNVRVWIKKTWRDDGWNILFLLVLYTLQGVAFSLGLIFKLVLMSKGRSYKDLAIIGLCTYPYAIKWLWAPLVDSIYSTRIGRRKSWLLPLYALNAVCFLYIGYDYEMLLHDSTSIWRLTFWCSAAVLLTATTDMVVDGWTVTLLQPENYGWQMTCNYVGFTLGIFAFMFASVSLPDWGWYPRQSAFYGAAVFTILITIGVGFYKETTDEETVKLSTIDTYKAMWLLLKNPTIKTCLLFLITNEIGFSAMSAIPPKLVESGVPQATIASVECLGGLLSVCGPFLFVKMNTGKFPFSVYLYTAIPLILCSFFAAYVIGPISTDEIGGWELWGILFAMFFTMAFLSSGNRVSSGAIFPRMSDPAIASTSYTLFITVQNLGRMTSASGVLYFIDYFSDYNCTFDEIQSATNSTLLSTDWNYKNLMKKCVGMGGKFEIEYDAFYPLTYAVGCFGIAYVLLIRPYVRHLEKLPAHLFYVITPKPQTTPAGCTVVKCESGNLLS